MHFSFNGYQSLQLPVNKKGMSVQSQVHAANIIKLGQ